MFFEACFGRCRRDKSKQRDSLYGVGGDLLLKSPKFDARSEALIRIFQPSEIERIWKSTVRVEMRNQALSDIIEHMDFHFAISREAKNLTAALMSGEYKPESAPRMLVEKSKGLCRQVVIPDHRDALVLQCISNSIEKSIIDASPTDRSFYKSKHQKMSRKSYTEYDGYSAWLDFQKAILDFSKSHKYIIVTDIANYYDSIPYGHLRNIIASKDKIDESVLDILIYLLSNLLWQPDYMPRIEVGLPQINMDAPRMLAHAFLYEVDEHIFKKVGGDFARFMDDIDVGVDKISDAKSLLKEIDLILQSRQIRLNSGKTKILTSSEASHHFRVEQNARLDMLDDAISSALTAGIDVSNSERYITRAVSKGIAKKEFDDGNGEKILKRFINLANKYKFKLKLKDIETIIKSRPNSREEAVSYLAGRDITPLSVRTLSNAISSGMLVDHFGTVMIANSLVESKASNQRGLREEFKHLISYIDESDYFGFYSKIIIQSKYTDADDLFDTISRTSKFWFSDYRSGRLVGGMYPIMKGSGKWEDFVKLVIDSRNVGAAETYRFHARLEESREQYVAAKNMLQSPNPSRRTGITHSKFLVLLSAIRNNKVDDRQKLILINKNSSVWGDVYYRALARRGSALVP